MYATYSPDDNKLRLYSLTRLPDDVYKQIREAGFIRAPKQDLWVAPMWTPAREDLLVALCGEIEDEDTSLTERAEERAERFEGYEDRRAKDAEAAHAAVEKITSGIPFGQPILVGHHSERRARRDVARIDAGMRQAVRMWDTSKYWRDRAAGALRHAQYKLRADVRARRIKKIEADKRRAERSKAESQRWLTLWTYEGLTLEQARVLANVCHLTVIHGEQSWTAYSVLCPDEERYSACPGWTVDQVQEVARRVYPASIEVCERWIAHYDNRLIYERAMLEEQGASHLLDKKPRPKQLPLCNYRAPNGLDIPNRYHAGQIDHYPQIEMTQREYADIWRDYKGTRIVDGTHRVRTAMQRSSLVAVFLTDAKVHDRPPALEDVTPDGHND